MLIVFLDLAFESIIFL